MNTFQIIIMSLAAVLILSTFWGNISSVITNAFKTKVKPYEPAVDTHVNSKNSSLVEIVRCWEHLKSSCEKQKLDKACEELDKIFPLFVPNQALHEESEVSNV